MKKVVYNGGNESYYGSFTNPSKLVKDKEYEVVSEQVFKNHTEYRLRNVKGVFNSSWFTQPAQCKPTFVAISSVPPKEGECFECKKLVVENGQVKTLGWRTSTVLHSEIVGQDGDDINIIYRLVTNNSVYVVYVPYGIQ